MTPLQKPEWLELAANDNATSRRKTSRGLPVLALVATAAIIGAGAIFAQSQDPSVANADSHVAVTSETAQPVVTADPAPATADPAPATTNPVAATSEVLVQNQNTPVVTSAPKIQNPSIGVMPTGGGDDEDDEGDEGDEGDDDEGDDD